MKNAFLGKKMNLWTQFPYMILKKYHKWSSEKNTAWFGLFLGHATIVSPGHFGDCPAKKGMRYHPV